MGPIRIMVRIQTILNKNYRYNFNTSSQYKFIGKTL